jgi:hypothetical protein
MDRIAVDKVSAPQPASPVRAGYYAARALRADVRQVFDAPVALDCLQMAAGPDKDALTGGRQDFDSGSQGEFICLRAIGPDQADQDLLALPRARIRVCHDDYQAGL